MINLEYLNVGNNKLKSLPESIGNLFGLEELYLNHNKLKLLPKSIINLSNLEILDLLGNKKLAKCIRKYFFKKKAIKESIERYVRETFSSNKRYNFRR